MFMITAGIGLAINFTGTIVFWGIRNSNHYLHSLATGQSHGHSHSHGHGHGHGHGHKDKKKKEDHAPLIESVDISNDSQVFVRIFTSHDYCLANSELFIEISF